MLVLLNFKVMPISMGQINENSFLLFYCISCDWKSYNSCDVFSKVFLPFISSHCAVEINLFWGLVSDSWVMKLLKIGPDLKGTEKLFCKLF